MFFYAQDIKVQNIGTVISESVSFKKKVYRTKVLFLISTTTQQPVFVNPKIFFLPVSDIYLIETPGCTIPNFTRHLHLIESKYYKKQCGKRAVFIENTAPDIITFSIVEKNFEKNILGKKGYKCCYQFALRSTVPDKEDSAIT